jgi:hypothetical protein
MIFQEAILRSSPGGTKKWLGQARVVQRHGHSVLVEVPPSLPADLSAQWEKRSLEMGL